MNCWTSPDGKITLHNVHNEEECYREECVIHNPTKGHTADWPLHWRSDRGFFERICPHGIGHPAVEEDPRVHGCDGCGH